MAVITKKRIRAVVCLYREIEREKDKRESVTECNCGGCGFECTFLIGYIPNYHKLKGLWR